MRLYNSIGPNPRVVRMFLAERGIDIPKIEVDLRGGENRQPPYTARNVMGQTPALECDGGTIIAEITTICEYLDETTPGLSLIGSNAMERAETRMWVRRIDLNILEPLANGFRYSEGLKLFQPRIHVIPQAADDLKAIARENLAWLDGQMADKTWVCGARFTLADILLFCFVDFAGTVRQPLDPANATLMSWFERMKQRPSCAA